MKNTPKYIALYVCCLLLVESVVGIVYAAEDRASQFKKILMSYEVEGLSLGSKIPALEKTLTSSGYKLKKNRGGTVYVYVRRKEKYLSKVTIRSKKANDTANAIAITLPITNGEQTIDNERNRLLKAFEGSCKSKGIFTKCRELTDTNELLIKATFSKKSIQYTMSNLRSSEAKNLAHARGHKVSKKKGTKIAE